MMDLSTTYLGLDLPHPLMPGASPLAGDLDAVRRLEDAGAAAIVMYSLFEEQITGEQLATHHFMEGPAESFAEALTYLPEPPEFTLGPEDYLEQVRRLKDAVQVPVIASLNGSTPGGWLRYARLMEEAGADAIELNVYRLATDAEASGEDVEALTEDLVEAILKDVKIPVAVKLSPFYSSLPHFAARLDRAGVGGLVLFNRFYQPDIDVETLEVSPVLRLSDSSELLLRIRWLAILSGRLSASLALSGGVHTGADAVKAILSGAHAVQVVSALLRQGAEQLGRIRNEVSDWMEQHEYDSIDQMRGAMSLRHCDTPEAFTRANYMRILQSWRRYL
jgi:dihydroorotate dehydrogenase (fumarate)